MKHKWITCEYCNGTSSAKTITWWCFHCCHPMINDCKPWFRWVLNPLEDDTEAPEVVVKYLNQ